MNNYNVVRLGIALLYHLKELGIATEALSTPVHPDKAAEVVAMYGTGEENEARRELLTKTVALFNVSAALKDFFETHKENAGLDPLALTPQELFDVISARAVLPPLVDIKPDADALDTLPVMAGEIDGKPVFYGNAVAYAKSTGQTHPGADYPPKAPEQAQAAPEPMSEDEQIRAIQEKYSAGKVSAWETELRGEMLRFGVAPDTTPEDIAYWAARGKWMIQKAKENWPEATSHVSLEHLFEILKKRVPHVYQYAPEVTAAAAQPSHKRLEPEATVVDAFAARMLEKMALASDAGEEGWIDPEQCTVTYLFDCLTEQFMKEPLDFVDIANFCTFLQWRIDSFPADKMALARYARRFKEREKEAFEAAAAMPIVRNLLARIHNDGGVTAETVGIEKAALIAVNRLARQQRGEAEARGNLRAKR